MAFLFKRDRKQLLNTISPGAFDARLGDAIIALELSVADLKEAVAAGTGSPIDISGVTGLQNALDGKANSADGITSAERAKLDGIAATATKNDTDANLKNRTNHTGSQAATTVTVAADATNGISAGNLQTTFVALAARVKALETTVNAG